MSVIEIFSYSGSVTIQSIMQNDSSAVLNISCKIDDFYFLQHGTQLKLIKRKSDFMQKIIDDKLDPDIFCESYVNALLSFLLVIGIRLILHFRLRKETFT